MLELFVGKYSLFSVIILFFFILECFIFVIVGFGFGGCIFCGCGLGLGLEVGFGFVFGVLEGILLVIGFVVKIFLEGCFIFGNF